MVQLFLCRMTYCYVWLYVLSNPFLKLKIFKDICKPGIAKIQSIYALYMTAVKKYGYLIFQTPMCVIGKVGI